MKLMDKKLARDVEEFIRSHRDWYYKFDDAITKANEFNAKTNSMPDKLEVFSQLYVFTLRYGLYNDFIGWLYEHENMLNKRSGEVYTPMTVVDFMVAVVSPFGIKKEGNKPITILDPACGTGRFMIGTYKYAKVNKIDKPYIFWNIDIQRKNFIATVFNAVVRGISAIVILGNSLTGEVREVAEVWTNIKHPWIVIDDENSLEHYSDIIKSNQRQIKNSLTFKSNAAKTAKQMKLF